MTDVAIRIEGLGKRYRLGTRERYPTFRELLANTATAPFVRLGRALHRRPAGNPPEKGETLWALKDVSLQASKGEVLGVIGRNGAGKSTLLKILSRITTPTLGHAEIQGRVGSLLEVGTGFHPELTGRENIVLNGAILGMRRAEVARKFDAIVAFAEVQRFIDTPVKHYSSGMYTRLAFAVAAHLEPEILIVDEVLAVGDAAFQRKCLGRMEDVAHGGRTVLFVSHNLDAVRRLCQRCLLLHHGRVLALGPTGDVLARYLAGEERAAGPEDWIDLAGVRRVGSGEARFVEARYTSRNPDFAGHPYPGGRLEIELAIDARITSAVDSIAVNLASANGTRLVNVDILSLGQTLHLRPGRNVVRFEIEALHLLPGTYSLGLWLGPTLGRVLDHIEMAFSLDVVDAAGPGFGTIPPGNGLVACRFQFRQLGPAEALPRLTAPD